MIKIPEINWISNVIHEWGQPEENPWKNIVLARIGGIACAAIEAASFVSRSSLWLGLELPSYVLRLPIKVLSKIASNCAWLTQIDHWLPNTAIVERDLHTVANIIAGLASTIFFGVIFSPELNFRIHLKLELAVDNLTVNKEKHLRDKQEAAAKGKEIRRKRAADLQMQRVYASATDEIQDEKIDAELANLLISHTI